MSEDQEKKIDRYGFFATSDTKVSPEEIAHENRRVMKWMNMLKDWKRFCEKNPKVVKRRIRKGIPDSLRGRVWFLLLSSDVCADIYYQRYNTLAEIPPDPKDETLREGGVIDRDIGRTFPEHAHFCTDHGVGQNSLSRVLRAFANSDTTVRYTQSMNYIAAYLLNYMTEEKAYLCYCQLLWMPPYNMMNYFCDGIGELHIAIYKMERLLERHLPKLYKFLKEQDVLQNLFAISSWFMCIYCQNFDPKFVVRIWDIFFAEGWPIIFQVALALFQSIQDEIMELTADEILVFIQHGSLMFDYKDRWITKLTPDELIKKALKFKVTEKDLEKIGRAHV